MCIPAAFAGIDGSKPLQHFPLLFGLFFMDAGSRCHRTSPDTMVEERWVSNVASILTLVIAVSAVISNGLLRKPIVVDALEDNGAIACVTNILKENRNFTWTICSADDELRMTEFYGYHYETITFLRELQDLEKIRRSLCRHRMYIFCGKIPIDYAGSTNHKEVTVEGAEAPLPSAGGIEPYLQKTGGIRCAIFITGHRNLKNFIQTRWKSIMKQTVLFVIVYSRT